MNQTIWLVLIAAAITYVVIVAVSMWAREQYWKNTNSKLTPRTRRIAGFLLAFLFGAILGNALTDGRTFRVETLVVIGSGILLLLLYSAIDYARNRWNWFVVIFESMPFATSFWILVLCFLAYGFLIGLWSSNLGSLAFWAF